MKWWKKWSYLGIWMICGILVMTATDSWAAVREPGYKARKWILNILGGEAGSGSEGQGSPGSWAFEGVGDQGHQEGGGSGDAQTWGGEANTGQGDGAQPGPSGLEGSGGQGAGVQSGTGSQEGSSGSGGSGGQGGEIQPGTGSQEGSGGSGGQGAGVQPGIGGQEGSSGSGGSGGQGGEVQPGTGSQEGSGGSEGTGGPGGQGAGVQPGTGGPEGSGSPEGQGTGAQPVTEPQEPEVTYRNPEDVVYTLVEDDYFADAVFIGDSRMVGMYEYGELMDVSTFYVSKGMMIFHLLDAQIVEVEGQTEKITVEQALSERQFAKIYLEVGINEMGTGDLDRFLTAYQNVLTRIQELQPDAIIYVQAIMKVTSKRSAQGDYITNEGIDARNAGLATLVDNVKTYYLDVNPLVTDETGGLNPDYTFDGVHLKGKDVLIWKNFLKEHAISLD